MFQFNRAMMQGRGALDAPSIPAGGTVKWIDPTSQFTFSESGRLATSSSRSPSWPGIRCDKVLSYGKWYCEFVVTTGGSPVIAIGVGGPQADSTVFGHDQAMYLPHDNSVLEHGGWGDTPRPLSNTGWATVWGVAFDYKETLSKLYVAKDNDYAPGDPSAGTLALAGQAVGWYETTNTFMIRTDTVSTSIRVCAHASQQTYSPPTGYTAADS